MHIPFLRWASNLTTAFQTFHQGFLTSLLDVTAPRGTNGVKLFKVPSLDNGLLRDMAAALRGSVPSG